MGSFTCLDRLKSYFMSNSILVEGVNKCLGHIVAGMRLRQLNEVEQCSHVEPK